MEQYLGSIIVFAGNYQIRGSLFCSGQLLSIAQNTALFSLLGTTYGGDGVTTFALPDLRGRAPVGIGTGNGLPTVTLGEVSGTQSSSLIITNLPQHNHPVSVQIEVSSANANSDEPAGSFLTTTGSNFYATTGSPGSNLGRPAPGMSGISGGNQPFGHLPPYLAINYLIVTEGIYPSRN